MPRQRRRPRFYHWSEQEVTQELRRPEFNYSDWWPISESELKRNTIIQLYDVHQLRMRLADVKKQQDQVEEVAEMHLQLKKLELRAQARALELPALSRAATVQTARPRRLQPQRAAVQPDPYPLVRRVSRVSTPPRPRPLPVAPASETIDHNPNVVVLHLLPSRALPASTALQSQPARHLHRATAAPPTSSQLNWCTGTQRITTDHMSSPGLPDKTRQRPMIKPRAATPRQVPKRSLSRIMDIRQWIKKARTGTGTGTGTVMLLQDTGISCL